MRRLASCLLAVAATVGCAAVLTACGAADTTPGVSTGDGDGAIPGQGKPITVQELAGRSADTPVAVRGLLHVAGGVARLCDAVLESYPVQCGEPSVELVDLDLSSVEGMTTVGDIGWKEGVALELVRAGDGRFRVVDIPTEGQVSVVLGLYSGVADPEWALSASEVEELATALAALAEATGPAPSGGLGYHGFTVTGPDRTLVAFDGTVTRLDTDPPSFLDDPGRTVERLLLETARAHVKPAEIAEVERVVEAP